MAEEHPGSAQHSSLAVHRMINKTHALVGYYGHNARVEKLGETSPGGYHLHYLNEPGSDETQVWLDPADGAVTGVCLGSGDGFQNDVIALLDALAQIAQIEAALHRELAARLGVTVEGA